MSDDFNEIDFDETDADMDYDSQEEFEDEAEGQDEADEGSAARYSPTRPGFMDGALTVGWLVGNNGSDQQSGGELAVAYDYYDKITKWTDHLKRRPDDDRARSASDRERALDRSLKSYQSEAARGFRAAESRMKEWKEIAQRDYEGFIEERMRSARRGADAEGRSGRFDKSKGRRLTAFEEQAAKRAARRIIIKRIAKILIK